MDVQSMIFQADESPHSSGATQSSPGPVATTLISGNLLVRSGVAAILAGTTFKVSEATADAGTPLPPDRMPGLVIVHADQSSSRVAEIVSAIRSRSSTVRVAVLADHVDLTFVLEARKAGVDGFCLTTARRDVLIKSLELIMLGQSVIPSGLVRPLLQEMSLGGRPQAPGPTPMAEPEPSDARMPKLTSREAEIVRCLMAGDSNKHIARKLEVAEATVKVHVKAILRKIGAGNRTQAAIWGTEHMFTRAGGNSLA